MLKEISHKSSSPVLGKDFYRRSCLHDGWRSDEHGAVVLRAALEGLQLLWHRQLGLEGVDLCSEEVALHLAVQAAQQCLPSLLLPCSTAKLLSFEALMDRSSMNLHVLGQEALLRPSALGTECHSFWRLCICGQDSAAAGCAAIVRHIVAMTTCMHA